MRPGASQAGSRPRPFLRGGWVGPSQDWPWKVGNHDKKQEEKFGNFWFCEKLGGRINHKGTKERLAEFLLGFLV